MLPLGTSRIVTPNPAVLPVWIPLKSQFVITSVSPKTKYSGGWLNEAKTPWGGFKLHLRVNDQGEALSIKITAGNVDERKPLPERVKNLWATLYADKRAFIISSD